MLLARGVNINYADGIGQTALHYAAINGESEAVQLLLEKGASLKKDNFGRSALHKARKAQAASFDNDYHKDRLNEIVVMLESAELEAVE